ncbi:MAG: VCBS domain-containing protein [Methyloligellaceae bacterium]
MFTDNGDGTISIDPDQYGDVLTTGESRTVTVNYDVTDGITPTANTASVVIEGAADNVAPVAGDDVVVADGEFLVNDITLNHQETPKITHLEGGGFVVVWYSNDNLQDPVTGIKAKIFDQNGSVITSEFLVNEVTAGPQYRPSVAALEGGGFIVVWDSYENTNGEVKARVFDAYGNETISEFLVAGDLGLNDRGYAVATALDGGGFAVAWQSDSGQINPVNFSTNIRIFDEAGNQTVPDLQVPGGHLPSIVLLDNNRFVITWQSNDADGSGIIAKIFDTSGNAISSTFIVNQNTDNQQIHSNVTALKNGDFVVSWQTNYFDYDNGHPVSQIYVRSFNGNGTSVSTDIRVDEETGQYASLANVASLENGDFVVVWKSQDVNGLNSHVVKARVFSSDGTPQGSEFIVHHPTTFEQYTPDVTGLPGGGFVVTWMSSDYSIDPKYADIEARIFDANGQPVEGEDTVTTFTSASLLANDTDADGDTLTITAVSATSAKGATVTLNGDGSVSYDPANIFNALASGETDTDTFTYTISDGNGGTDTATVILTITGQNDAPIAVDITGEANEDGPSIVLTANFTDADASDTHIFTIDTTGTLGSVINNNDGTFTYNPNGAFESLAEGETVVDTFNYTVDDGNGGIDTKTATVTITGQNDAPVILEGGDTTGIAVEDSIITATGSLTATDVDNGAILAWTLQGGAQGSASTQVIGNVDYNFQIDQLTLVKNGTTIFEDNFDDGIAPPSGGLFSNGNIAEYGTGGVFTESNGRAVMDGSLAGPSASALFTSIPFLSHTARLQTNRSNDPADINRGLKNDDDISLSARFDLIIPDENHEAYGIRLTDRVGSDPSIPGDDAMELVVRRGSDGVLRVQFRERDYAAGTVTPIDSIELDPTGADQIVLHLDHSASNLGVVTASFDLLNAVTVIDTVTFTNTGQIFGTETPGDTSDDELWTRAQIVAYSPGEVLSSDLAGDYGSLTIDGNGNWSYQLDNSSAAVQALAEGEIVTDTFTAIVADEYGATDTQTIAITITGRGDAPVIIGGVTSGDVIEDTVNSASGSLTANDVDTNTLGWTLEGGKAGAVAENVIGEVDYNFQVDQFSVDKNGTTIFTDDFDDGIAPPSGGQFSNGAVASYSVSGIISEAGGRAILDGSQAGPTQSALFTSIPFLGTFAALLTNRSEAPEDQDKGLKDDDDFTVQARFDLILPDEPRETYGIRLSDRVGSDPSQQGDDVIEFVVRQDRNGELKIHLSDRSFVDGTNPILQEIALDPMGADQIVLKLSHSASDYGVVTASYELLSGGTVIFSDDLDATGTIFGSGTPGDTSDDENWTRAQIIAFSPGEVLSSTLEGNYGTLTVDKNGDWTYNLDNSLLAVQALSEGEQVTDTFTAIVADELGGTDSQEIIVTVTGTNDAPIVVGPDTIIAPENTALTIPPVEVYDVDEKGELNVRIDVSESGQISLLNTTGLTFTDNDGSDGTLEFSGSLTDINAAFTDSMVFTGTTDGTAYIEVTDSAGTQIIENSSVSLFTDGDNTISNTVENDLMFGGIGNDTFIIQTNNGHDTIGDFIAGTATDDVLDFQAFNFTTKTEALNIAYQDGDNVVFEFDLDNTLTLEDVLLSQLSDDDVII